MVTELHGAADRERARALIESRGLAFEPGFDDLVGAYEEGRLVGAGARQGNVLKMIAIDPAWQSGSLLGELMTELARLGLAAGHPGLFVFTRPEHVPSFEALNFELLAGGGRAALLEYGGELRRHLERHRPLVREGNNGAVVVNCNPFTLGHRHLVEEAARRCDTLYVFVVREDRSAFPFEARLRLVREGTRDLANVRVLDTSHYAVSAVTFPSYFLKQDDPVAAIQMELDLVLFARRLAPFFHVRRRFFGSEPLCAATGAYNQAMRRLLPPLGIEAVEVPRLEAAGGPISASRVRELLRRGDLEGLEALVPRCTLAYLLSDEGRAVVARLRQSEGRHA
ncbi:MAG TPA: [citrate (pro-3S)-lyase] ligase [Anaeromyxobacteraceae bacterium]|jgi:[citrate (pro-3S)-lyase] ligase|nr:[citrate (pro-3S)-lyase] ligase [Anaeromyxobacteraceae bacterium]